MPVTVRVPCRIRVDARALAERGDEVEAAFAAALGRALERSRREVVSPRGGYLAPLPHEPSFRWSGPGSEAVPSAARRAFEARLRRVLNEALTAAGIGEDAGQAAGTGVPRPLPPRPSEPFDPARLLPLLGAYRLPSYDSGGADTVITFEDDVLTVDRPRVTHEWVLRPATELRAHLGDVVREAVRQHGPLPPGVPAGLIARVRDVRGRERWLVLINTQPRASYFTFDRFGETVYRSGRFEVVDRQPPAMPGTVERRLVSDRAGLIAAVDELMGEDIRRRIEEAEPRGDTTSVDEYAIMVDRAVDREVERRVDEQLAALGGRSPTSLIVIRIGGQFMLLIGTEADDATLHWTGTANILPVTVARPAGGGDGGEEGEGGGRGDGGQAQRGAGTGGGGQGDAAGTGGEGAGTGRGPGTGGGRGGGGTPPPPGGFVFDPSVRKADEAEGERSRFPVVGGGGDPRACRPFNGEPLLAELGTDGEHLRRMIDDIAFRLQMGEPCYYPANFCLMAAEALRSRAAAISTYITTSEREAFTMPVPEGTGDLGPITFRAVASPAVQFLRHLAGVVPRIHNLALEVMRLYSDQRHWPKVRGGWIDNPASWRLHFLEELSPALDDAVGQIFLSGCQAMLLQLLLTSRQGIQARLNNFDRYAPIFERLMVTQLTGYAELQGLRDALRRHQTARTVRDLTEQAGGDVTATLASANPATAWFSAARALSGTFLAAEQALATPGAAGEIVERDGVARIRDSNGVLWSEAEIEQALVTQRGLAEGIDPLVKQITDLPDVMARFRRDPTAIRAELRRVLGEMADNNAEMLVKARADAWWAFRASRISEHIPSATIPGTSYALQGIHLEVHRQLGEFFGGDVYYGRGVDSLFSAELGRQSLGAFALTIGIIALSVLCPPAGFLVGVGVAIHDVARAHERERLYGALIDPELVLTRAEVEAELFAAYLGLALSLIPEAGTIGGAIARGTRVALRGGLRMGARAAGRYVVRRVSRQIIQAAQRDLLQAFITEVMVDQVMQRIVEKVLQPVLAYIEREAMLTESVGGPEGARFVLLVLESGRQTTTTTVGRAGVVR